MPTKNPRTRAYNLRRGEYVIIAGALHGETTVKPLTWKITGIEDHDPTPFYDFSNAGFKLGFTEQQRTLTLRHSADPRRTYQHTVPRNAHVTLTVGPA